MIYFSFIFHIYIYIYIFIFIKIINYISQKLISVDDVKFSRDKWVTVITAWSFLRLQDLVGVQEVRTDTECTVRAGDYNFFYRKEK